LPAVRSLFSDEQQDPESGPVHGNVETVLDLFCI
jgi:hypothetical protein